MEFRWNRWNLEHVATHGVDAEEAQQVVLGAEAPYPLWRPDDKWLVWGRGRGGRFLQVIFVIDPEGSIFVIHARPLTDREKKRVRRRSKP